MPKLVEKQFLAELPDGPGPEFQKGFSLEDGESVLAALNKVLRSPLVRYTGKPLTTSVEGGVLIVKSMVEATSLPAKSVSTVSDFHSKVYERCANFCIYEKRVPQQKGKVRVSYVYGFKAMELHCADLEATLAKKDPSLRLPSLRLFREFRWLLPHQLDVKIQKLINEERKRRQNLLDGRMLLDGACPPAIADDAQDEEPLVVAQSSKKSASSSSASASSTAAAEQANVPRSTQRQPAVAEQTKAGIDAKLALFFTLRVSSRSSSVGVRRRRFLCQQTAMFGWPTRVGHARARHGIAPTR